MDKIFHRPVKPFKINQKFGENNACIDDATNSQVVTCDGTNPPVGYHSLYGPKGHLGVDIAAYHGQEVYCIQSGEVVNIDTNPKSGLDVRVVSNINGKTYKHIYEHLLGYQPKIGDKIVTGQLIGWADNTGYSSGNHLHLQVEELPLDGKWTPIDPIPLMSDMFAKDVLLLQNKIKYLQEQVAMLADRVADWLRRKK